MRVSYTNLGAIGIVADQPAMDLPGDERNGVAWSDSLNVRYRDGAAEVFRGHTAVFSTPPGAPRRLLPITSQGSFYWVYPDISAVYATDGVTHANITPTAGVSASYSATNEIGWNGGAFNGYMILNNARQIPLSWLPGLGNDGEQMNVTAAWPTTLRADVIRSYRNYVLALRCTEGASYNPRLLRWSNGATPGSLPTSWDYTDVTLDAGRLEFGQTEDSLIDCLPLRDINVLYKQNHTWAMQWVGGNINPFIFRQVFSQVGLMAEWCVGSFEGKHLALTTNDVVVHDLNQAESIVDKKMRSWLFSRIEPTQTHHCFVAPNYLAREMWVCFPESGREYPNLALVWNWAHNTIAVRELGGETPHISWGSVETGQITTIDSLPGSIDSRLGPIDDFSFNPTVVGMLMANPTSPSFLHVDSGATFNGSTINARLTRESLPIGKDALQFKRVKRIYPRVLGPVGSELQIFLGRQTSLESPITYQSARIFTVGVDRFVNCDIRTTHLSIRLETTAQLRIFGFDLEFDLAGHY